jgi:hypothetical protein
MGNRMSTSRGYGSRGYGTTTAAAPVRRRPFFYIGFHGNQHGAGGGTGTGRRYHHHRRTVRTAGAPRRRFGFHMGRTRRGLI